MNVIGYIFVDVCREREVLFVENIVRYQVLKAKWKEFMRIYQFFFELDVFEIVFLYFRECQNFYINNDLIADVENRLFGVVVQVEEMDVLLYVGDEQFVFFNLIVKVCFYKRFGWNV